MDFANFGSIVPLQHLKQHLIKFKVPQHKYEKYLSYFDDVRNIQNEFATDSHAIIEDEPIA